MIDFVRHQEIQQKLNDLDELDPRVEKLVNQVIGRVADKWTMVIIDLLAKHGTLRYSQLGKLADGISQKMLTQTIRAMEREGLVNRTVFPVVPPRVAYHLTDLGLSLGDAFCGVWIWAENNIEEIERARREFDETKSCSVN